MPRSHICNSCGHDLSWIKAPPDPRYGLAVVICPKCETACTRHKPGIEVGIRQFKASLRTGIVLIVQSLMLSLLVGISSMTLFAFAEDSPTPATAAAVLRFIFTDQMSGAFEDSAFADDTDIIRTVYVMLIVISIGAGVWMRSALGHLRLVPAVLIWYAMVVSTLTIVYLIYLIEQGAYPKSMLQLGSPGELVALTVYLLSTLPFFAIGLPIGARARKIWLRQYTAKAHKRRRNLRKHRMNHARPTAH